MMPVAYIDSPAKDWVFTLFNYTDEDEDKLKSLVPSILSYVCYGKEVGPEDGTPHLQGFLSCTKKLRLNSLKTKVDAGAHYEKRKGTVAEAIAYCEKDSTLVEHGTRPKGQGSRSDLSAATDAIVAGTSLRQIALDAPSTWVRYHRGLRDFALMVSTPYDGSESVRGYWFFGASGVGKSYRARQLFPNAYLKPQSKWFDGYAGEETIILDDLDKGGFGLGHHLKIWADRYGCTGETKGGTVPLQHKRFVITSNYSISELFSEADTQMQDAISRRFHEHRFEKEFTPPLGRVGEGEWIVTVTPPLNI